MCERERKGRKEEKKKPKNSIHFHLLHRLRSFVESLPASPAYLYFLNLCTPFSFPSRVMLMSPTTAGARYFSFSSKAQLVLCNKLCHIFHDNVFLYIVLSFHRFFFVRSFVHTSNREKWILVVPAMLSCGLWVPVFELWPTWQCIHILGVMQYNGALTVV